MENKISFCECFIYTLLPYIHTNVKKKEKKTISSCYVAEGEQHLPIHTYCTHTNVSTTIETGKIHERIHKYMFSGG